MLKAIPFRVWPSFRYQQHDASNSGAIDQATDLSGVVLSLPYTGTITAIGVWFSAVTTAQPMDIRLEGVNSTTGANDGVLHAANTYGTISSPAVGYAEASLVAGASVTAGQVRSIVGQFSSTVGNVKLGQTRNFAGNLPYGLSNTTGTTSKSNINVLSVVLKYQEFGYVEVLNCTPPNNSSPPSVSFNSSSSPSERGNVVIPDRAIRVVGAQFIGNMGAGGLADLVLYDAGGTQLRSVSLDGDGTYTATAGPLTAFWEPIVLAAGSLSHVMVKPTNTTNVAVGEQAFTSTDIANVFDGDARAYRATKASGVYTYTKTARVMVSVIIDREDDLAVSPRTRVLRRELI